MGCKNGVCTIGNETYEEMVLKKAIETYGEQYQMVAAMKSLSELMQGLTEVLNKANDEIEPQIASAYIALEQLRIIFDAEAIDETRDEKIKELADYVW